MKIKLILVQVRRYWRCWGLIVDLPCSSWSSQEKEQVLLFSEFRSHCTWRLLTNLSVRAFLHLVELGWQFSNKIRLSPLARARAKKLSSIWRGGGATFNLWCPAEIQMSAFGETICWMSSGPRIGVNVLVHEDLPQQCEGHWEAVNWE